jgi:hypothetical protein
VPVDRNIRIIIDFASHESVSMRHKRFCHYFMILKKSLVPLPHSRARGMHIHQPDGLYSRAAQGIDPHRGALQESSRPMVLESGRVLRNEHRKKSDSEKENPLPGSHIVNELIRSQGFLPFHKARE